MPSYFDVSITSNRCSINTENEVTETNYSKLINSQKQTSSIYRCPRNTQDTYPFSKNYVKQYVKLYSYICIPRVNNEITKSYIFKKMCFLKIGYIENINEIPLKTNPECKRIIIKLKWDTDENSLKIRKTLDEGGSIQVVYEMPWFWKIFNYTHDYRK